MQEAVSRGGLLIVMGDMNARVGDDTGIWGEVLAGMVRKCAMRIGGNSYSSSVSTIFGSQTHGFHTKESTNTHVMSR